MTFDDGHQRLDIVEQSTLLFGGKQVRRVSFFGRGRFRQQAAPRSRKTTREGPGVEVNRLEVGLDEAKEVGLQPGHSRELKAVSDLVQRDPQSKVCGYELVLALCFDDV